MVAEWMSLPLDEALEPTLIYAETVFIRGSQEEVAVSLVDVNLGTCISGGVNGSCSRPTLGR